MMNNCNSKTALTNWDEPTVAIRRRPELQLEISGSFQRVALDDPERDTLQGDKFK